MINGIESQMIDKYYFIRFYSDNNDFGRVCTNKVQTIVELNRIIINKDCKCQLSYFIFIFINVLQ